MIAKRLLLVSSLVFAASGLAYVVVPGSALAIVGIASSPETDFLLRTEGVVFLLAASTAWIIGRADTTARRTGLVAVGGYLILSSVVDLAAFAQGIVGIASVPSAIVRIAFGAICLVAASRRDLA